MPPLPPHSPGVLAAPLGELTVLYDLATEVVHVLNATAGLVWASCDGATDVVQVVELVTDAVRVDPAKVASDVTACVAQLTEAGLLARTLPPPEPVRIERPVVSGAYVGVVHAVIEDGVRFWGDDVGLLRVIDDLLGPDCRRPATVDLGVIEDVDGSLRVQGWGDDLSFHSRDALLEALPTVLNQVAAASTSCIALHAGCVRSPAGEVVLLPAVSGSGKTTLTASLVQAGWDYGTDEAVGIRHGSLEAVTYPKPLVLDASSRSVLGLGASASSNVGPTELHPEVDVLVGTAGPVGRVVLPHYEAGAALSLSEPLAPRQAVIAVLEHALNLARVGQPGLDAVCHLAAQVRVQRLTHGDVAEAVETITAV